MGVVRRKAVGKYPVVDGVQRIPDAAHPRGFREYCVTQKAWDRRREELAQRANNRCEGICKRWIPPVQGDGMHILSTGAGGDDALDNLLYGCRDCHRYAHQPKAVPRKS